MAWRDPSLCRRRRIALNCLRPKPKFPTDTYAFARKSLNWRNAKWLAARSACGTQLAMHGCMRLARSTLSRHLRVFCVSARCLSFKTAGQMLSLTPSAISHQVRELEEQLRVRLFVRKSRALSLTPAGQALLAGN